MKFSKKIKKIWNIFSTAMVAVVVLFAVLLVGVRFFGIQVFTVISGSMEPDYPVGSLIYVKDIDPSEVKVGNVITYVLPSETPSTHRVVRIDAEKQHFYTKGDANEDMDFGYITDSQIVGVVRFKVLYIGYPSLWLRELFD